MADDSNRPIVITGLGRSGTTWMQTYLSQHARIHIHGQSPNLPWQTLWQWYEALVEQGRWSQWANRHTASDVPHYAGSGPSRTRDLFRRMFREYFTGNGPDKPRWGLKWIDLPAQADSGDQIEQLWPDMFWIVCVRDPFRTIESAKNTFLPDLDQFCRAKAWVRTCEFAVSHASDNLAVVHLDQLDTRAPGERLDSLRELLCRVGEVPTPETDEFVRKWPVVHKVVPDPSRVFRLTDEHRRQLLQRVPGLCKHAVRMGYNIDPATGDSARA